MRSEADTIFLDTNVFIYAATQSPIVGEQVLALQSNSRNVIQALADGRVTGFTSLTVLQEIVYLLARWARQRAQPELYDTARQIATSAAALVQDVFAPTTLDFSRAIERYTSLVDFNDLLIVETMHSRGITTIVSSDRGLDALDVLRLDPGQFQA